MGTLPNMEDNIIATITSREIAKEMDLPHPDNGVYIEWDIKSLPDDTAYIDSSSIRVCSDK